MFRARARGVEWVRIAVAAVSLAAASGCASTRPTHGHPGSEAGMASYYGDAHQGRRTANGERFDMHALTAAHRTLPFGTRVKVTNLDNGRSVVVRINDRGPYVKGRVIDLSKAAARELRFLDRGTTRVRLEVVSAGNRAAH
jgi:rare lipoprotein A